MYELLYIVPAIYAEDELKKVTGKIDELLKAEGAEIIKSETAAKLKMAYTIKRHNVGYYILVNFNATPDLLKKINRALQLEHDVLRFLITKAEVAATPVKMVEFSAVDPSEKRRVAPKVAQPREKEKDKIKLEDIDQKLDTLLDKDIV
ncbi:MAG: 30S ribosomal protein S6 [Patescibacteria group bacterium]